jgi:hypothetical protein
MQGIVIGALAACLTIVTAFWQYQAVPAIQAAAPPVATLVPAEPEDQGNVHVGPKLEEHWSEWNGSVALFAHRTSVPHREADLDRARLLVPTFSYGPLTTEAAVVLRQRAERFAADAHMQLEEESRVALFRARFLDDRTVVAFVPSNLSTALGLDSAASVQRLAFVTGK